MWPCSRRPTPHSARCLHAASARHLLTHAQWGLSNCTDTHLTGLARGSTRRGETREARACGWHVTGPQLQLGARTKRVGSLQGEQTLVCKPGAAGSLPQGPRATPTWCRSPRCSVKKSPGAGNRTGFLGINVRASGLV